MLARNQDFERAIAEFDHVFSRIPPYVASSGNHAPSYNWRATGNQKRKENCSASRRLAMKPEPIGSETLDWYCAQLLVAMQQ